MFMGLFDEWKIKRECLKSGRKKEYDEYKKSKQAYITEKNMHERYLQKAKLSFEEVKKTHNTSSQEYLKALDEINRWTYAVSEDELKLEFMRPNNIEDIKYREQIIDKFSGEISKILLGDTSIRFHGTPIYFTREILKSGGIFSSSSRFDGYDSSTDLEDEISVTTAETINRTLSFFTDFYAFSRCLPAGCLFVLRDNGAVDSELVKYASMKSFKFREQPERILGICTTEENILRVKGWLKQYGYDENIVYTYEQFLNVAKTLKKENKDRVPEEDSEKQGYQSEIVDAVELINMLEESEENEYLENKGKTR